MKEREDTGRRVINAAVAVGWTAFGLVAVFAKHDYYSGGLQLGLGGLYVVNAVPERSAISPKRARFIRIAAVLLLVIAGAVYLFLPSLRHS